MNEIDFRPRFTIHGNEPDDSSLLIGPPDTDLNPTAVVGLVIREPDCEDGGVDLSRQEAQILIDALIAILDEA